MFIAHLPAAYLLVKPFQNRLSRIAFAAGLLGSVLPDVDLLLFYFWDAKAFHHHEYLTHRPILWALVFLIGLLVRPSLPRLGAPVAMLGLGGLIHMVLDSIAGAIAWGWPLSEATTTMVHVPATHDHWILSFLTHWTFLNEVLICLLAGFVLLKSRRS
ncbi:MAG: metal-dependent hydrolase [Thalassovita sp.]